MKQRPLSNLPFVWKILESIELDHLPFHWESVSGTFFRRHTVLATAPTLFFEFSVTFCQFFFFSPALVCCIEWWSVTLFSSWNNVWISVSRTSVVHTCRIAVSSGRSTASRLLELHCYRMLLKDWCCVMLSLNSLQLSPLCRWHTTVTSPQTLLVDCNGAVLYSLQRVQHPDGRHSLRVCPAILLMTRLTGHLSEVKYKTAVIIFNISLT